MKNCWEIQNNILLLNLGSDVYIPSAKELFIAETSFIHGKHEFTSPKEIKNITFSKRGLPVQARINYNNEKDEITFNLYTVKEEKEYALFLLNNILPEHIIIQNTWHFLGSGFDKVSEFIKSSKINLNQSLSIKDYLEIKKFAARECFVLHDNFSDIKKSKSLGLLLPAALQAKPYTYQQIGYEWLKFMYSQQCGCILGDEMGLGKTLQVIMLIAHLKEEKKLKNILIVAPISLIENWRREFKKFYPKLNVFIHHGSNRTGYYKELLNYEVVIMSYSNVQTDLSMLKMIYWDLLVLDEAQNIKNPYAQRTTSIKGLRKRVGIAVTGTPFENNMRDIWSLVDFVLPNYLGTLQEFDHAFSDNINSADQVEKLITPILLRRLVNDVAKDLPEKVIIPQPLLMSASEAEDYEKTRSIYVNSHFDFAAIQKLRMCCTHPNMINIQTSECSKYERLCELLCEIFATKEKAIVFTSFNQMFEIIKNDIPARFGVSVFYINGITPQAIRQKILDDFCGIIGPALIVLNPRAAGTGLNIMSANHVIHYNLEWNPAIEDQASARSYRRGQQKTVFIYRLFYVNSIEEIMNERINRKRDLFNSVIIGNDGKAQDKIDLIKALDLSPFGGKNGI